ncbi:substrate-binding periplasmic protein [Alteromonas sp. ASW11-130]|uniref:substrate-binding periplasmic protein n=1 Tax=Alteromonas sp. ASW11-130 TaxID=3015775 RepID=UPI0022418DFC|nr:transporter substrate-binding domain-containing protein [Alteromonas sp. ASW11-130]MCW8093253.1 transporter substrate-binding domain-containing protein [Alteromonas sp. ASW11-130]
MKRFICNSLFILLAVSASAQARQIEVAAGWDKPPYIISRGHTGFELELVKSILNELGHQMVPIYVPMGRIPRMVSDGSVDIGLNMNPNHKINREFLSEIYIAYQNVAVSLTTRNVTVNSPADLKNYTVIGFQTAKRVLGQEYANAVNEHAGYLETPQQSRQVAMLVLGSVDVAVMDRNIFSFFKSKLPSNQQFPTTMHEIFPINFYHAGIPDPELRAEFNRVLGEMIQDGRYKSLIKRFHVTYLLDRIEHPMEEEFERKMEKANGDENLK